jgi:hypothetical protein
VGEGRGEGQGERIEKPYIRLPLIQRYEVRHARETADRDRCCGERVELGGLESRSVGKYTRAGVYVVRRSRREGEDQLGLVQYKPIPLKYLRSALSIKWATPLIQKGLKYLIWLFPKCRDQSVASTSYQRQDIETHRHKSNARQP